MVTQVFTPTPVAVISGVGPYDVDHPYAQGALRILAELAGVVTELTDVTDYTVAPLSSDTTGTVTLSAGAATTYDGGNLYVQRRTDLQQGFSGQNAREKGFEAQLDFTVQAVQDANQAAVGSLRSLDPAFQGDIAAGVEGKALVYGPGATSLIPGPDAGDIAAAQTNAATATAAAAAAAAAADTIEDTNRRMVNFTYPRITSGTGSAFQVTTGFAPPLETADLDFDPWCVTFHEDVETDATIMLDNAGPYQLRFRRRWLDPAGMGSLTGDLLKVRKGMIRKGNTVIIRADPNVHSGGVRYAHIMGGEVRDFAHNGVVVKLADEARNSTIVPAADPDLQFLLRDPGWYEVKGKLYFDAGAGGYTAQLPASIGNVATILWNTNAGTTYIEDLAVAVTTPGPTTKVVTFEGTFLSDGEATFFVNWCQQTSDVADTILKAGSWLRCRPLQLIDP